MPTEPQELFFSEVQRPLNPYQLGFAARGGYTFPFGLHVGARVVHHLGEHQDVELPADQPGDIAVDHTACYTGEPGRITRHWRITYLGPEVGYDVHLGPVLVRPYLSQGLSSQAKTVCCGHCNTDREDGVFVALGTMLLGTFGPVLAGVDVWVQGPAASWARSYTMVGALAAGMRF
jgi:hypothetical protein